MMVAEKSASGAGDRPGSAELQLPAQRDVLNVGDCLDYTRSLPDESVDLVVFSPPYDGVRDYRGDWVQPSLTTRSNSAPSAGRSMAPRTSARA